TRHVGPSGQTLWRPPAPPSGAGAPWPAGVRGPWDTRAVSQEVPMSSSRWERFAPLTCVVFFVLLAISFALSGSTPDTNTSTADTVSYWSSHDSRQIASAIIGTFSVIFFIWFGGSLRSVL